MRLSKPAKTLILQRSCNYGDLHFFYPHQQLRQVDIHLLLHRERELLLIITKNMTHYHSLCFLPTGIFILTPEHFWSAPYRYPWPERCILSSMFLADSIEASNRPCLKIPITLYFHWDLLSKCSKFPFRQNTSQRSLSSNNLSNCDDPSKEDLANCCFDWGLQRKENNHQGH